MRILYLDIYARYINPTRALIPGLLGRCGSATFFGPGYVSSARLAQGLETFLEESGPFDLVVASGLILFSQTAPSAMIAAFRRNYFCNFPVEDLRRCFELSAAFRRLDLPRAAMLLESDYYNFTSEHLERLDDVDWIIGWDDTFVRPKEELEDLGREHFSYRVNDNWFGFVGRNRPRIIPLVHFVADEEFDFGALAHRPHSWCVPGVAYAARRDARDALEGAGWHVASGEGRRRLFATLDRLRLRPYARGMLLNAYHFLFRREIARSRFAFTCGSGLRYPIRKFFEIPALGAVLACEPCSGFEALGFRDGVHAFVASPAQLPELGRRLSEDLDLAQEVAIAGRRLIMEKHTLAARSAQLRSALDLALRGAWHGGAWRNGALVPATSAAEGAA